MGIDTNVLHSHNNNLLLFITSIKSWSLAAYVQHYSTQILSSEYCFGCLEFLFCLINCLAESLWKCLIRVWGCVCCRSLVLSEWVGNVRLRLSSTILLTWRWTTALWRSLAAACWRRRTNKGEFVCTCVFLCMCERETKCVCVCTCLLRVSLCASMLAAFSLTHICVFHAVLVTWSPTTVSLSNSLFLPTRLVKRRCRWILIAPISETSRARAPSMWNQLSNCEVYDAKVYTCFSSLMICCNPHFMYSKAHTFGRRVTGSVLQTVNF